MAHSKAGPNASLPSRPSLARGIPSIIGHTPKFAVSFLKALYGDAATKPNRWAFDYLPKVDRNYSWTYLWDNMYNGIVKEFSPLA